MDPDEYDSETTESAEEFVENPAASETGKDEELREGEEKEQRTQSSIYNTRSGRIVEPPKR